MDSYTEIAKMMKPKDTSNNVFIGEVINTIPLKIRINGNDLTSDNIMISDSLSNFTIGQKVVTLNYSTRLYIIIARV
jgi:hypothetical protein